MKTGRTPEPPTPHDAPAAGQARRRLTYGLNVAVAIVAAIALVILANVLIDWQVRRLPAGLKPWLRYDLTATRAYTLAPQTRKLLAELDEDWQMVAVLRVDDKNGQDDADLLQEYARYSARLQIQQIHPDCDLARLEAFYRRLEARFANETQPLREAIGRGLDHLASLADDLAEMQSTFASLAADPDTADESLQQSLQLLSNQLGELAARYRQGAEALKAQLNRPLAPLSEARAALVNDLRRADAEVLAPFARQFERQSQDRSATLKVRDTLLRMGRQLSDIREQIKTGVDQLAAPAETPRYDQLVGSLSGGEAVVLLGPDRERVVPVAEMFVATPGDQGEASRQFIGEDRLTGALLTMRIDQSPMAVFVHDQPASVVSGRGGFSHIAARLLTSAFEVTEWAIGGGDASSRGGQSAAASPPPKPAEGQSAIWIVPALDLQRTTQADRQLVADVLRRRLAEGDGVLLCFDYDPEAAFRPSNPLLELCQSWGLDLQMSRLVLHESLGQAGRPQGDPGWLVGQFPEQSPLASALAGRDVQFAAVCPIEPLARPNVNVVPLVELSDDRLWIVDGLNTLEAIRGARFDPQSAAKNVMVAAAVTKQPEAGQQIQTEPGRLIAFTERHWLGDAQAGRRLGNSELFMSSAYWLAGMDEAIAATPRSQDIRRIDALTPSTQLAYKLLLIGGLPALALLAGGVVWAWRRRG